MSDPNLANAASPEPVAIDSGAPDPVQPGIFYRKQEAAPDFFRLVAFNFTNGVSRGDARKAIETMWEMLKDLQQGIVRDLLPARDGDPEIRVNAAGLVPTLCLGTKLFRSGGLLADRAPTDTPQLGTRPFAALRWSDTAEKKAAQTDYAIALHANSELGVARAVVELQKLVTDRQLPVKMVCFFSGMHRDDRRSWIDFHDGINNMESGDQRRSALQVVQNDAGWLVGGSTMLFLKIAIDLAGWRALPRTLQEALVGRNKLTGCPLDRVVIAADGTLETVAASGCPMTGDLPTSGPFVEIPGQAHDRIVIASHIHRTNPTRGMPDQMQANRIYRQGYEFVDSPPDGGVRVGLNFVSFQNDFDRVTQILETENWLRNANFGGIADDPAAPAFPLMSIVAGGYFLVPPIAEPFPGAEAFLPAQQKNPALP